VKYIAKRKRHLDCLYDENLAEPTTEDEAKRRWSNYSRHRNYDLLFDVLFEEQYGLCAYSELRPDEHELSFHVEHVKPKSKFPALTFDYRNLVLSALSADDLHDLKIEYPQEQNTCFGGHAKSSLFDKNKFLSPLRAKAKRNYLLYLSTGKVIPNPNKTRRYQKKVQHTINLLNLNHPMLVTLRKDWIEELSKLVDQHLEDDMCLTSLAKIDLEPTAGKLSNFFTATCQLFGPEISNPIAQHYY
jgi:uncharacterized protein (TIGR02646 family)